MGETKREQINSNVEASRAARYGIRREITVYLFLIPAFYLVQQTQSETHATKCLTLLLTPSAIESIRSTTTQATQIRVCTAHR